MRSFAYFLRESLRGFTRNLSTTLGSIVTIFLSLLLIGVFLVFGFIVENVMSSVEDEVSIAAYVSDDITEETVTEIEDYVSGLEGVASVSFTTKEQALENFSESNSTGIIEALDGQNPLPASIDVELADPQLVEEVAGKIESYPAFAQNCGYDTPNESIVYGQESVKQLFSLTNYVRYIGVALIALLIFIAFVFINNTIRLAILARRKEIAIMRLVGASNGFIRGPFLMEGALHAVLGAALAVLCLELARNMLLPRIAGALKFLAIDIQFQTFLIIYLALLVSGLLIGLLGSALAMRRYLKV